MSASIYTDTSYRIVPVIGTDVSAVCRVQPKVQYEDEHPSDDNVVYQSIAFKRYAVLQSAVQNNTAVRRERYLQLHEGKDVTILMTHGPTTYRELTL